MKKLNIKTVVFAGVLVAMNLVLARVLAINIGTTLRITVSATPIYLAGFWFGPIIGGICGGLSDLLGCLIQGYAPNPFILVSSILTGVLPGLFKHYVFHDKMNTWKIAVVVIIHSLVGSLGFTYRWTSYLLWNTMGCSLFHKGYSDSSIDCLKYRSRIYFASECVDEYGNTYICYPGCEKIVIVIFQPEELIDIKEVDIMGYKTDIEIAQECEMLPITEDYKKSRYRRQISGAVRKVQSKNRLQLTERV